MQPNNTITGVEIFSDWDDTCDYKKNSLPNQEQIIDVEKLLPNWVLSKFWQIFCWFYPILNSVSPLLIAAYTPK